MWINFGANTNLALPGNRRPSLKAGLSIRAGSYTKIDITLYRLYRLYRLDRL